MSDFASRDAWLCWRRLHVQASRAFMPALASSMRAFGTSATGTVKWFNITKVCRHAAGVRSTVHSAAAHVAVAGFRC